MKLSRTFLAFAVLAACSSPDAPEVPTWAADVRPILAANCVRCHAVPSIGGAPDSFRLDRYEDTVTDDGRVLRGAGTMSEFIAARTAAGTMPPVFDITGWQVQTLQNWHDLAVRDPGDQFVPPSAEPPPAGSAPDNQPPAMRLLRSTQEPSSGVYTIDWEIRDPDRDLVGGQLLAEGPDGQIVVTRELRAGRGTTTWDAGVVLAGSYQLRAELDDGSAVTEVSLGALPVTHVGGNVAPQVTLGGISRHSILADRDSPVDLIVRVEDPDPADTHLATIVAEFGDQRIVIEEDLAVSPGNNVIPWDTTGVLPEEDRWRITATVSDGSATRSATVEPVVIRHVATVLVYEDDIDPIFELRCAGCHPGEGQRIPGVPWDFANYSTADTDFGTAGVYDLRNLIYWRVIRQRNMPPQSAALVITNGEEAFLTADERDKLEEWLQAGAPR